MKNKTKFCIILVGFFSYALNSHAELSIFAAEELKINNHIPSKEDFERPFEDSLPAMITDSDNKQLIELNNCRDYLSVRKKITGSDNDADYRVLKYQTVSCEALALLKLAVIPKQTALEKDFVSYTDTKLYPATLWPLISDNEKQSSKKYHSLFDLAQKKSLKEKNSVLTIESSGYGLNLTLLAKGDFNSDGWEDIALRVESYSIHGSYSDTRIAILTRTDKNSSFSEVELDF